jgi:hypothetical protein
VERIDKEKFTQWIKSFEQLDSEWYGIDNEFGLCGILS